MATETQEEKLVKLVRKPAFAFAPIGSPLFAELEEILKSRKGIIDSRTHDDKNTLLMHYAKRGDITRVRLLLFHGASPYLMNAKGQRALDLVKESYEASRATTQHADLSKFKEVETLLTRLTTQVPVDPGVVDDFISNEESLRNRIETLTSENNERRVAVQKCEQEKKMVEDLKNLEINDVIKEYTHLLDESHAENGDLTIQLREARKENGHLRTQLHDVQEENENLNALLHEMQEQSRQRKKQKSSAGGSSSTRGMIQSALHDEDLSGLFARNLSLSSSSSSKINWVFQ